MAVRPGIGLPRRMFQVSYLGEISYPFDLRKHPRRNSPTLLLGSPCWGVFPQVARNRQRGREPPRPNTGPTRLQGNNIDNQVC